MNPKEPNTDMDEDFDPAEIDAAAQEMADPGVDPAPEINEQTANLTTWDEAPGTTGKAAQTSELEDGNSVAQELVQDGVESADRDRRLAAADPDYEP